MHRGNKYGDKRPRRWEHKPEPKYVEPESTYDTLSEHSKLRVDAMLLIQERKEKVKAFLQRMDARKEATPPMSDRELEIVDEVRRGFHNPLSLPERPELADFQSKAIFWKELLDLISEIE